MEKGAFLVIISFMYIFFFLQALSAVDSELTIENAPPVLIQPIPNQSWSGGNLLNAFNLDDYFESYTNLTLTYSASDVENITILINNSNVSFYADSLFSGSKLVVFYADDGFFNTSSNLVNLSVGIDNESPQWSSMQKDLTTIYQNDFVSFSANWTDNVALKNYTFFINQGSGYVSYSGNFGGVINTSYAQSIQISAAGGNTVYWYFCAWDTSSNTNCTDVGSFSVSSRPVPSSEEESVTGQSVKEKIAVVLKKEVNGFVVSVPSLLVSLKQGSTKTRFFEITNTGNTALNFTLGVSGITQYTTLSKDFFSLPPGGVEKVTVDFSSEKDTPIGEYYGSIDINSFSNSSVSVVLDVNSIENNVSVMVEIPEEYKFVRPGNIVVANITLKNLKDLLEGDVDLHLSLSDFKGNVYDYSDEKVTLTNVVSFMRNFTIPKDMVLGEYIIHARVSKDDLLLAIDSDDFQVGIKSRFLAFVKSSSILLLIILLSLISILFILRYRSLEKRKKALDLYVNGLELKKLMANGKFDDALGLFIKLKSIYGEPVTKEMLENKEELKNQMKNLAEKFHLDKNLDLENSLGEGDSQNITNNKKNVKENLESSSNPDDKSEEEKISNKKDISKIPEKDNLEKKQGGKTLNEK